MSRPTRAVLALVAGAGLTAALSVAPGGAASAATGGAWLRVGHFSPSTGPVDVYIDGRIVDRDLRYEAVTPYKAVSAGEETVALRPAGDAATAPAIATTTAELAPGAAVTVAAVAGRSGPSLRAIPDNLLSPRHGDAKVRVAGLDDSVTTLTAVLRPVSRAGGPLTFGPVAYGSASAYRSVPAGTYDLQVTNATGATVLSGTDWPVAAGTVASIVVATTSDRATVEVLRDATGASVMPTGGAQTGMGGTAGWSHPLRNDVPAVWPLSGAAAVVAGLVLVLRRHRRTGVPVLP